LLVCISSGGLASVLTGYEMDDQYLISVRNRIFFSSLLQLVQGSSDSSVCRVPWIHTLGAKVATCTLLDLEVRLRM
jgi:hypothetical protein